MTIPSLSLAGQVALVTGARRGIGEACALVLAEAGADVAVCDSVVETGELARVAERIEKLGRRSLAARVDVTRKSQVDAFVTEVVARLGTLDILVNNAGIRGSGLLVRPQDTEQAPTGTESTRIAALHEDTWDRVIETNLKGCYLCSQAAARTMVERRKGSIISVSSMTAFQKGLAEMSPYSISKRGIIMLTAGLAADLAGYGIRVNAIAPGGIETEMMREIMEDPERLQRVEARMLLGNKLIPPSVCANVALFLASDLSAYVTGQTIIVDAGLTLSIPLG